jgi:hypothetical protein
MRTAEGRSIPSGNALRWAKRTSACPYPAGCSSQNLVEFWAAITRPVDENGLGFTSEQAAAEVDTLMRLFVLLPELPLLQEWRRLVAAYRVSGKNTHDARQFLDHGRESTHGSAYSRPAFRPGWFLGPKNSDAPEGASTVI